MKDNKILAYRILLMSKTRPCRKKHKTLVQENPGDGEERKSIGVLKPTDKSSFQFFYLL